MRIKMVKAIFKKEIMDILRDKKTLFMGIILPIIMYPILMIVITQIMTMSMQSMESENINIAFEKEPSKQIEKFIENYKEDDNSDINIINIDNCKKGLEDGKISAYIGVKNKNGIENYNVYINSSKENASTVKTKLENVLSAYKDLKVKNQIKKYNLDENKILNPVVYKTIDTAKNEEMAGSVLGQVLPFILVMGVLLGAIYPAIDSMAGEKERGTLETLFTLPITNLELVTGKYIAVSTCAIVTALLNILSILLTLGYILATGEVTGQLFSKDFSIYALIGPLVITLICICLFAMVVSAISMCVCSLAKSFKDAQNYITPVMFLVLIPSYVSMIPNMNLNAQTAVIPVVNISLLIKGVLTNNAGIELIALVFISNFAFAILSMILLSKMFNSEEILFGNSKNFSFLEKRSNIKKGTMPSMSDGIVLYAVSLVLLIYIGSYVQLKFGRMGIVLTEIGILALPVLFAYYIKSDFKKLFSIKLPKFKHIVAAIFLWIGSYLLLITISNVLLYIFPENQKIVQGLNNTLIMEDNLWLNLLIIGVLPAICEETLFRGFLLTSFKNNKKSYKSAIILSGVLFGMMHMDFIRIIPISILGIALGYAVCKSDSIVTSMLMHFMNNSFIVIIGNLAKDKLKNIDYSQTSSLSITQVATLLIGSFIFVSLGVLLFNNKKKKTS